MSPLFLSEKFNDHPQTDIHFDYVKETLFVVPSNDGEALRANQILTAIGAPHHHISRQRWGATIDNEWQRLERRSFEGIKRVLLFEMPGRERGSGDDFVAEQRFLKMGIDVDIVDHHHYSWVDRYHCASSLEQLCAKIGWKMDERDLAIAVNDRSHICGLKKMGYSATQIRHIRRYDMMAQGHGSSYIEKQIALAHTLLPPLEKAKIEDLWIFRNVRAHSAVLLQEIALRSPYGMVHVFEIRPHKLGFSGKPAVVDQLLREDFSRHGCRDGYSSYGGGDSSLSKFWGFKPAHPEEVIRDVMERSVLDTIIHQLRVPN